MAMDTTIQPRQKIPSKLSAATARYERLTQKEKEKRVATVGANHPALAASRVRGPKNPEITSHSLRRTSPRRSSPAVVMGLQAMVLSTQKGGNNKVSILTPCVILQQPPVLDVDVADYDAGNILSRVSSDVSSADTSIGRGTQIIGKEMTVAGEVEGEYPPLPDDKSFY